MSYQELYGSYRDAGGGNNLVSVSHKWEKPGDMVVGRLTGINIVESSKNKGSKFKVYSFDTDDGIQKITMGKSIDDNVQLKDHIGEILAITFLGKKELPKGRTMNEFRIEIIPEGTEDEPVGLFAAGKKRKGKSKDAE